MIKKVRKTINGMDKSLLIVTVIFFAIGLLNIVTASSQVAVIRYKESLYNYFYKQLAILFVGFIATIFIVKTPTSHYKLWGNVYFMVVLLLSIFVSIRGEEWSGNKNWIAIPLLGTVQPSEFAKPAVIIVLSMMFEKYYYKLRTKNISHLNMIGYILMAGLIFPLIIFTQKDMGTMFILTSIFAVMFLASPILKKEKMKTILLSLGLLAVCLIMMVGVAGKIFTKSQTSRLDFWNPCKKYESTGYQICNGFIAINTGGLKGVGIGESKQKSYIPESHTDSVFAIIAEEYGFLGSTLIFLTYIFILYRILRLSANASTIRGRYMCLGFATYIFLHILINLGGLFGVMPLTGVPLPFLSYGGSFTLSLTISLAIIQRISIETKYKRILVD